MWQDILLIICSVNLGLLDLGLLALLFICLSFDRMRQDLEELKDLDEENE